MMSKILRVFLSLLCLVSLCGCNHAQPETTAVSTSVPVETTVPQTRPVETTVPETQPKDTTPSPASGYEEILEDYRKVVDYRLSESFETDYNEGKIPALSKSLEESLGGDLAYRWRCMLVEMVRSKAEQITKKESFGYVLEDLNGDGNPELFWVRSDGFILAVFTMADGQPRLVDAFWPRYRAVVTPSGELYTRGSGGATLIEYQIRQLTPGSTELTAVKEFGQDEEKYYEVIDRHRDFVTEARFQELLTENPFEIQMNWEMTPL